MSGEASKVGGVAPFLEKFSHRARQVMTLAQEEARGFNHNYIGTEHLLLGLVRETEGVAAKALGSLGVKLEDVRKAVEHIIGRGDRPAAGEIGLTPRARQVLSLAVDEASSLGHASIGTEHLLLGLIREGEGIAAGVLQALGVTLGRAQQQTLLILSGVSEKRGADGGTRDAVLTCRVDSQNLTAIDMLVEAGIRTTRSDAASWLIRAGIESHRDLFQKVAATVVEIRRLRFEAQRIAQGIVPNEAAPQPASGEQAAGGDAA